MREPNLRLSRHGAWMGIALGWGMCIALGSDLASAQSSGAQAPTARSDAGATSVEALVAKPPPEFENRPRSPFERTLMGEVRCTCGTCGLEPIDTCGCEFAATMRGEVLAELDKHDLSTEAGRRVAADSVRAFLVAEYGPKVIHHPPNLDAPLVIAAGIAAVVVAGVLTVRRRRRRAATKDEATSAQ